MLDFSTTLYVVQFAVVTWHGLIELGCGIASWSLEKHGKVPWLCLVVVRAYIPAMDKLHFGKGP